MSETAARVMYFSDAPYFGGAERYLELLITRLDREKFEPCFVMKRGADLKDFARRLEAIGVPVFETTLRSPYHLAGYWNFFRLVRRWKPDILHVNLAGTYDAQSGLVAPVARAAGCRFVVTTEHLAMVETLWKRRLAKRVSALFIQRVISITYSNIPFLTEVNGVKASRLEIIHNGIDITELDAFEPPGLRAALGLDQSVFLFSIVGSLIERKGHRTLLDAFARLAVSGSGQTALLVVGDGPEEPLLKRRARQLGLDRRVFFLGHRDDAQGIMHEIDCLVVPSLMEGMPFVILEAMGASKPVIASKIFGIPEVIVEEETGLLVTPAQAEELSRAMLRILEHPELARAMGANGRNRIEDRFSAETMARRVESVYSGLLHPDVGQIADGAP